MKTTRTSPAGVSTLTCQPPPPRSTDSTRPPVWRRACSAASAADAKVNTDAGGTTDADGATSFTVPVESIANGKAKPFFLRPGDTVFVPERWY